MSAALIRGVQTSLGEAGKCLHCGRWCPEGPDICLGYLPAVSHACCGHGEDHKAYVVIGGTPDCDCAEMDESEITVLQGPLALAYFDRHWGAT